MITGWRCRRAANSSADSSAGGLPFHGLQRRAAGVHRAFRSHSSGSLLYVKNENGDYVLVGAMYSAPPDTHARSARRAHTAERRALARSYEHLPSRAASRSTTFYVATSERPLIDKPGVLPVSSSQYTARRSTSASVSWPTDVSVLPERSPTPPPARAAGGHLLKQAFGWMVHVYPFNGDDLKVAFGMSVPEASGQLTDNYARGSPRNALTPHAGRGLGRLRLNNLTYRRRLNRINADTRAHTQLAPLRLRRGSVDIALTSSYGYRRYQTEIRNVGSKWALWPIAVAPIAVST